jgi:hypothetical protein
MRHLWLCIIDGCLIRSGPVQPGDTMRSLMEKLSRTFPHMAPDSLKIIREDGRIFDTELGFSNPSPINANDPESQKILAAVGVVEGYVGVKVHQGKTIEEILQAEAGTISGKINDNMDYAIYDFTGEQLASIEDMIALLEPENAPEPLFQPEGGGKRRRGRRNEKGQGRGRGRRPQRKSSDSETASPKSGEQSPSNQNETEKPSAPSESAPRSNEANGNSGDNSPRTNDQNVSSESSGN